MDPFSYFDRAQDVLNQFSNGRTRPLSRTERHALRVSEQRLKMLVRRDPESAVELSPYMQSILGEDYVEQFNRLRNPAAAATASI